MARIRIDMPQSFAFRTEIPVRITDLNYGGHVGNDNILSIMHELRVRFLKHYGFTEMNIAGVGLIMSDVAIEYKAELFYGDLIKASITVGEFSKIGFDIFYKLEKTLDDKSIIVAIAKTGMVCYHYDLKKIVSLPKSALEILENKNVNS
jgi:acyl-CoA thioester hydrolase